ncbi:short chain dehydrogenase [Vibrio makurazakiensis]|uniref:short chain dehydrogenase n=1 Tax=Vibrio makurazakiensis TaxID=2910250 RepID=UPI003D0B8B0B
MKILAIGANGIIGKAVVANLEHKHEVIRVGHSNGDLTVDVESQASIKAMFEQVGMVDAIVSMVGNGQMGQLTEMKDSGFSTVLDNKVMGQVNIVRIGLDYLKPNGSITLTSGEAAFNAMPGVSAIAMGTAAINAFISNAALELENGIRINAVSPSMVKETMVLWGIDSSSGIKADDVASYYLASIEGADTGKVFRANNGAYEAQQKPAYLVSSSLYPTGHPSLEKYAQACGPIFQKYGAKPMVIGNTQQEFEVIDGQWPSQDAKVSIVKFPSMIHIKECFESLEYQQIKHLRTDAIETHFSLAVE